MGDDGVGRGGWWLRQKLEDRSEGFNSHCVDRREPNRFMFLVSSPEHDLELVPKMFDELDWPDSMPPTHGVPPPDLTVYYEIRLQTWVPLICSIFLFPRPHPSVGGEGGIEGAVLRKCWDDKQREAQMRGQGSSLEPPERIQRGWAGPSLAWLLCSWLRRHGWLRQCTCIPRWNALVMAVNWLLPDTWEVQTEADLTASHLNQEGFVVFAFRGSSFVSKS